MKYKLKSAFRNFYTEGAKALLVYVMSPFAVMMEISLADIGAENGLGAEACLFGEARYFAGHFPGFKFVSECAT